MEYDDDRDWSSFKHATLIFECEHDEAMNFAVKLSKYEKRENWDIDYFTNHDVESLRSLNSFEILLMKLTVLSALTSKI